MKLKPLAKKQSFFSRPPLKQISLFPVLGFQEKENECNKKTQKRVKFDVPSPLPVYPFFFNYGAFSLHDLSTVGEINVI